MANKIAPQEFHFAETRNDASIRTKVPIEDLNDPNVYMQNVRQMRLSAGDRLTVQAMDEGYNVLLHEAEFLVVESVEVRRDIVDERGERTSVFTRYKIERRTDWWSSEAGKADLEKRASEAEKAASPPIQVPAGLDHLEGETVTVVAPVDGAVSSKAQWNLGHQAYEIIVDGKPVDVIKRHEGEDGKAYKARAQALAASKLAA